MLSLQTFVFTLLFLLIVTGVSCEQLTAVKDEESSLEGSTVTLSYSYNQRATGSDEFYWYRQHPGKPPEFLISHSGTGTEISAPVPGLTYKVSDDRKQMDLVISSAAVTDSAVYYCAVRPAGSGYKIFFGSGTRLTIETKVEYQPDYFTVKDENNTLCLVTGFSRYKAPLSGNFSVEFNETKPARIAKDSLFNQVIFLDDQHATCDGSTEAQSCAVELKPDEKVNQASLIILGLRVIFFKAVIFNILMTLRLWMSQ